MQLSSLKQLIEEQPIIASNRIHSLRLIRVIENIEANAQRDSKDDRLLHLMSRVGVFARAIAAELRGGSIATESAALLLDQLADIGDCSFDDWTQSQRTES